MVELFRFCSPHQEKVVLSNNKSGQIGSVCTAGLEIARKDYERVQPLLVDNRSTYPGSDVCLTSSTLRISLQPACKLRCQRGEGATSLSESESESLPVSPLKHSRRKHTKIGVERCELALRFLLGASGQRLLRNFKCSLQLPSSEYQLPV